MLLGLKAIEAYPLRYADGTANWREHPDADTDVLAIDVTPLIAQYHGTISFKHATRALFAFPEVLRDYDITVGDEVVIVGYPLGLRQGDTNYPLIRQGIIATRVGEPLVDEVPAPGGGTRRRHLRGFLVDGAAIPGSSGSPVVLRPVSGRVVKGNIELGTAPPFLLGILAETRYAPVRTPQGDIPSFAGLGLAFDAETIWETIDLFESTS